MTTTPSAVEESGLDVLGTVDVDDVLDYLHRDLKRLPGYLDLYRRYLRQRWDVFALDFAPDARDWAERMTADERDAFVAISSGFHHGERQVEVELPEPFCVTPQVRRALKSLPGVLEVEEA